MRRPSPDLAELLIRSGLDLASPFSSRTARRHGLSPNTLSALCTAGLIRRPLRGAYYSAHLADTLELRVLCLRLVLPVDGVITDRTAGWLHGAPMVLAPGDHLVTPAVNVFQAPGRRLRNELSSSGERGLLPHDVMEVRGLPVTTPLRTACDLGRLLHRDAALAALDALLGLGQFSVEELNHEVTRFAGYRGVRQLRSLVPLADPGSESFGESVLRLRWHDSGAAVPPETQVEILGSSGQVVARLDLASRRWRYGAEYDGAEFHGPEQRDHDVRRRARLHDLGWSIDVFRADDVFGRDQTADVRIKQGLDRARLRNHARSTLPDWKSRQVSAH